MTKSFGGVGVLAAGACTPLGFTLASTASAVRAGMNAFSRSAHLRDSRNGAAITVSMVEGLDGTAATDRMRALSTVAAKEATGAWCDKLDGARTGLFLALPEERPGFSGDTVRAFAQQASFETGLSYLPNRVLMQPMGSGGGLLLMRQAMGLLSHGELDVCLVGGVESHIAIEALHWIEGWGRLHAAQQPNGIVPGEGAAFLLLCSERVAERLSGRFLCDVLSANGSLETNLWYQRQPITGSGLTKSVHGALSDGAAAGATISRVYGDLNGESWRADEWGYAYLRNAGRFRNPLDVVHPTSHWGDMGAATGPLLTALAAFNLAQNQRQHQTILVWTASGMTPMRSACVLEQRRKG